MPKNGDIRAAHIPQIPMEPFTVLVDSFEQADLLLAALAEYDLFQYGHNVKPDYSNAGFVQVYDVVEGDWIDVEDDWFDAEDPLARDHAPTSQLHRFDLDKNREGVS